MRTSWSLSWASASCASFSAALAYASWMAAMRLPVAMMRCCAAGSACAAVAMWPM